MQRILFVSDNARALAAWQHHLVRSGYPVQSCGAAQEELLKTISPRPPEIFILDGTSVRLGPRELRQQVEQAFPHHEIGVIWLITEEMAAHLDPACGLDDFIILPSSVHELVSRVRLHLWKSHRVTSEDLITAGDLVIDQANYSVTINGRTLDLTFKEYELLRFLVTHRGRVFTREALLNQVWGYDYYGGTRTVDVHIRRIRAKLGPEYEDMVETIRNVGYRFNA